MVDVGNPSAQRILDRDHRPAGRPVLHGGEGVLEAVARVGLELGLGLDAGEVRVGAGFALEGEALGGWAHVRFTRTLPREGPSPATLLAGPPGWADTGDAL